MEDTVLQNALLGAVGAARSPWRFWRPALADGALRARAMAALDRVGLADHAATRTAALSHGQRRQLEVAVALTLAPAAFVMDEPMAGLSAEGVRALTALLDGLRAEAPILLVEHDMDAVFALADRISVLAEGRVIASGPVDAIRADPAVRAAYLGDAREPASPVRRHRRLWRHPGAVRGVAGTRCGRGAGADGPQRHGQDHHVRAICGLLPAGGAISFAGADLRACPPTGSPGWVSGWCPRGGAASPG
jgi:ABC-type sugar transport system ATPase subunit